MQLWHFREVSRMTCVNELQIVENFQVQKETLVQEDSTTSLADWTVHRFNMTHIYAWIYIDTRFILLTTNNAESVLSTCRHAPTVNLSRLSPTNIEAQLLFYSNRRLWGISDINSLRNWVELSTKSNSFKTLFQINFVKINLTYWWKNKN